MASTTQHHRRAIPVLAVALLLLSSSPMATTTTRAVAAAAATTAGCEGDKLAAGKTYANCAALPYLGARLHWTYDAKTGSLSVAFVAKPTGAGGGAGWVSWAVNPTGVGMKGAQALLAFKGASSTYVVNTYNLTGYAPLGAAPQAIAYKATELAADESGDGGEVRIYVTLQLGPGVEKVNHIWQVGAKVTNGAPAVHAFGDANVKAKGRLVLAGGANPLDAAAEAPAPAPAGAAGASPAKGGGGGAAPSAAATAYVSAPALALVALAGFLAM